MRGAADDNSRPHAGRTEERLGEPKNDWVSRPLSMVLWWCLPLGVGFSANAFAMPPRAAALVWMAAFAWMGTGCVLNAIRCRRLHCYISGPAFLLGALAAGLFGSGALALGPHALNNIVTATLGIVLLSFVPEIAWRKYA
ncbi:MAG TPA: hypothetical protein VG274_08835 [Rhizomicrobium sp.]|jgi:hypothetical protein|nr:hypothetical protein [Rhizomicrobium sp.]